MLTVETFKALYPQFIPVEDNYDDINDFNAAIAAYDIQLTKLIETYSVLFPESTYKSVSHHTTGLAVAHHLTLNDQLCLRVSTALKQIESGKNLSLDNILVKSCGCNRAYWQQSYFGQELLDIENQYSVMSFTVI